MRLLELEVENFGVFAGERFEFGGGFQLICGPNEAGKSTLLQLIREVFFGFPHRSPYLFADRSGEMAAVARIGLTDGRQVRFRRRKGKKGAVVGNFLEAGEEGDPVNEATLTSLLGNAHDKLYTNVFGFSLAELAAGEESLRQTDLTEALYGGGLGGLANFQKVREEIRTEHEGLFSPGASKREINRLLAEIKEKRRAVAEATVKPRDYQKVRDEAQQLAEEVDEVRARRESIQRRQAHLKRLSDTLERWRQLQASREELSQLQAPEGFPSDGAERFRNACRRREELTTDLEQARLDALELADKLAAIELRPGLMAREADVKQLVREVGRVRQYEEHIPQRRQESDTIKQNVLADVKVLNPEWDLSHLDQFQTGLAHRDAIDALKQEDVEIRRGRDMLEARRPDLVDDIEQIESELKKLGNVQSLPALEQLVERATAYHSDCETVGELSDEIRDADVRLGELKRQLVAPLNMEVANLADLTTPLAATISKYRDRFDESDESLKDNARRLEETEREVGNTSADLTRVDAEARVPDRDQLQAQRGRRDAGWRLIRRKYVEQDADPGESEIAEWLGKAGPSLADRYEREVRRADELADHRQEKAETVARHEQLAMKLNSLNERAAQLQQRRAELEQDRLRLQSEWEQAWSDCGLQPLSPDEMIEWLRIFENFQEESRQQTRRQSKLADVQQRMQEFETNLAATVGGDGTSDERLAEARRRVEEARVAGTRREQFEAELPQRRRQLEELDRQIGELADRRDDWQRRWRDRLQAIGFPDDWAIDTATKILSGLADARHEFSEAERLDQRVRDMQDEIEQYHTLVVPLCEQIAPDLAEMPAADAVEQVAERLEAAKRAAQDQQAFLAQHEKAEKRLESQHWQLDKVETEVKELLETAGAANESEFERAAARVRRHTELTDDIERLDREVRRVAEEEDAEVFLRELGAAKGDEVNVERQRVDEESREIETTYQQRVERTALARDQLQKLDRASEAAELAQQLESDRARLAAAVDRWAPLVLAQTLMARAIERFEREHQPEMMQEIGLLFSQMTGGRYTGVRRKLDEQGTLLLQLHDGSHKEPHELSTGTREQLYLAMRLAYVRHYCRDAEPLPLVMDDVLVNFDDERAKSTLRVLLELARDMQILFMTCHQNIAQMIAAATDNMDPIRLSVNR